MEGRWARMPNLTPPLQVEVCWDGVVATVTVHGELDITTAAELTKRLKQVAAAHPERLVLDLDGLVFVDVAGARALDRLHKDLESECTVILRRPRPAAREVSGLTNPTVM